MTTAAPVADALETNGSPAIPPLPVYRFSVSQYHAMQDAGILMAEPVELLEGWLFRKDAMKPPHRISVTRTRKALERAAPPGWSVDSQLPITTGDSEPLPDDVVYRGVTEDYRDRHPGPQDLGLVVEVADSRLLQDRQFKKRVDGRARVPVYWIVNIPDRRVEIHTSPTGPAPEAGYLHRQDYGENESVPLVLDGVEAARIPVRDLLP